MKKTISIGLVALSLVLTLFVTAPGGNALTPVSVNSGYCTVSWNKTYAENNSFDINITLPNDASYLNNTDTYINVSNSAATWLNITYNLTVNGNAVNASSVLANGSNNHSTYAHLVTAGLTETNEYLNIVFKKRD